MQQTLEKIGKQVFYKRLQQKMTQEELCQGICSVSYLSKIENGKIEASEEILQLLCTRLEIAVTDLRDVEEDVKGKLDEWLNALVHLDKQQVERIYEELQGEMKHVLDFEIINYYKLLYTRYLIMKRDFPALEEELDKLKKVYKKYSPFQKLLYMYSRGLLCCLQYRWKDGLDYLLKTEVMAKEQGYHETGLYYNIALAYTHLDIHHLAIHFVNMALEGFRSEYKFRNIINCQILIAVSYTEKGQYEEALKMYESILREATSFADKDVLLAITLSNMGSIYYKKGKYQQAKKYYLDSLQLQKQIDLNYLDTIYEMALVCIKLEELDEARALIDKGIDAAKQEERFNAKLYLLLMLRYKYFEEAKDYKLFLENEAIPLYKSAGNKIELKKVYVELAEHFSNLSRFEESNRYYRLVIDLMNDNKEE
ncbi:tetratricopeptide repeat protein [Bacillus thuringiensis]|uniref:Tetratricopeptide repeat protein n=7 Tax=Bacillus cereus group TaxID=86661 RepID=A0A9W7Q2Y1_BACCE|nr:MULTISPECIES: tetratricopeptide repeat protein [Bacillus]EAO54557.1 Transcriptional activator NprR [Bacillus thuringiensis serovar israelensis ATCC 35646]MED1152908.1 tetratricopeptide repeat protein [Bacillus paranthracis]AAQ77234.1 Rap-like protein [Bacillus thuringiensis serovar israelensis]AFQ24369.1 transcriptional activator NprR [Bacillus thuringiensis HD-789]AJH03783.1 helix-turn-helix family protein [Bacillus thuringiensis HD1002]